MSLRTLALLITAGLAGAGCVSNETKPEPTPVPVAAAPVAPPVAAASKPECPPEPSAKVKSTKAKSGKKAEAAKLDCEPAKPKASASTAKIAEPAPAAVVAAPAPAAVPPAGKDAAKPSEPGKPRTVKSRDGTFEGEVYGNIPANSKWAKLQIGMHQSEVDRILGAPNDVRSYVTGKAFIPFYFGSDRHRYEGVYFGQGSVSYTGGGMGGGQGILMMINYDPQIK